MAKPISDYNRPPRIRLALRLTLVLFLAVLSVGAVMGILVWRHANAEQRDRVTGDFPQVLSQTQEHLEALFRRARVQLWKVADDSRLIEALHSSPRGAARLLMNALNTTGELDAFVALDASGQVLVSTHRDAMTAGQLNAIAGEIDPHPTLLFGALVVSTTVRDETQRGEVTLAGVVSAPRIAAALEPRLGDSHIYLVADGGQVLARGAGSPPLASVSLGPLLHGGEAEPMELHHPEGGESIAQIRTLALLDVTLVVTRPLEMIEARLLGLLQQMALGSLLLATTFSIPIILTGLGIARGLEILSDGARRASLGELVEVADGSERHGAAALPIRNFNVMVRRLRHNQEELWEQNRRLRQRYETLQGANEALEQLSITDGLTKLHNHRYFQEALTREINRVSRIGEPLSMLLIDIDDFKKLNDCYGHATGDEILIRIARTLNQSVRDADILARYGGEEFVILAANTDLEGATILANKICLAVSSASLVLRDPRTELQVTVSIGVAEYRNDRKAFFHSADQALYSAKHAGKNCVKSVEDFII